MVNYRVYQFPLSQIQWNEELDGIIPKGWIEKTPVGKALFKQASTIESKISTSRNDWSEKAVWELTKLLKLPAARYELAKAIDGDKEIPGSISIDCSQAENERRYPVEEMLRGTLSKYNFPEDYTISNTIESLAKIKVELPPNYEVPDGIKDGADLLVGIVMLDAWIGNSDRHDRNLEIVKQSDGSVYLSPAFDNGNSLGATEKQELRESVSVLDYSQDYNYACFMEGEKDLTGKEALAVAAKIRPEAVKVWLNQLEKISQKQIKQIFEKIPSDRIKMESALFAQNLLGHNRLELLSLKQELSQTNFDNEPLEVLYERYSEGVKEIGLRGSQKIAFNALSDGMEKVEVVEMMKKHDSSYQKLINRSDEKTAERTVVSRAEIKLIQLQTPISEQQSQERKSSKSRGRSL